MDLKLDSFHLTAGLILLLVFLAFIPAGTAEITGSEVVEAEVAEHFKFQDEVAVIVLLQDSSGIYYEDNMTEQERHYTLQKRKIYFEELEKDVLSTLTDSDFELEHRYVTFPGFAGDLTNSGLAKLEQDERVRRIQADREAERLMNDSVEIVNASETWKHKASGMFLKGKGQSICIIDSGINDSHPDLKGKVVARYNAVNDNEDVFDSYGHGTFMAGVAAANGTIKGIAPGANLVIVKDGDATASEFSTAAGVDWCTDKASEFNITTISISTGFDYSDSSNCFPNDALATSIQTAYDNGITTVAASGNSGNTTHMAYPACVAKAISAGATNKDDTIWSGTNRPYFLELLTPGSSITSTDNDGEGYVTASGTSNSAPMAAGLIAIANQYFLLKNGRNMTPGEFKNLLNNSTGKLITDPGTGYSFPRIDVYSAVNNISPDLTVRSLSVINQDENKRIFEFEIFNGNDTVLNDINWTLETGEEDITTGTLISLPPNESAWIYVEYDYDLLTNYNITASAEISSLSDSDTIEVSGPEVDISGLGILDSSSNKRMFEFIITNNKKEQIEDINWTFKTGESTINSESPADMESDESLYVFVEHDYSSSGDYTTNASATNGTYSDYGTLQITI